MIRLITLGFCFSILFAFYALCDQSDVKYYITPTVGNLAVLHSSHEVGGVLHATTSEISGEINISSVGSFMSFEMDLGRLTAEERSLGSFFGDWFSNPRAYFHFSELAGWPKDSLPRDTSLDLIILVRDEEVYILTNRVNPATPDVTVIIYGSHDLDNWTEVVRFNMPTFARSFEYYDGAFYVGLGTSTASLNQACGNIYKVILPMNSE